MDLSAFKEPETRVLAQFSSRDNAAGDAPDWEEPKEVTLFVQRYPAKKNRSEVLYLSPKDFDWAEYRGEDFNPDDNVFLCEEYRMKILKILS